MASARKENQKKKAVLHPRSAHHGRYDFVALVEHCPMLKQYVKINKYGVESIDFADPSAVKMLNKALLQLFYQIEHWDIPVGYLCPPIPGRADYIHYIADLLAASNNEEIPTGKSIKVVDVGTGANCIYPIIGTRVYGWSFLGVDIDSTAVTSASHIIKANSTLKNIICKHQPLPEHVFVGVMEEGIKYDITMCNPPFHASAQEAQKASLRKVNNLTKQKKNKPVLNFGGQHHELWCDGGEIGFIKRMINESKLFSNQCFWFTTLVSKESNVIPIKQLLNQESATEVKILEMGQGNKKSRVIAWTFLSPQQQRIWKT